MALTGNFFNIIAYTFGGLSNFATLVPLRNEDGLGDIHAPYGSGVAPYNLFDVWYDNRPDHRYTKAELLATTLGTTPFDYALHPSFIDLMDLWGDGDLAIFPNAGPLYEPIPDRVGGVIPGGPYVYPKNVGAHDTFQNHHAYFNHNQEQFPSGWVGRLAERWKLADAGLSSNGQAMSSSINNRWPNNAMVRSPTEPPFAVPGRHGVSVDLTVPHAASAATLKTRIEAAIAVPRPGSPRHAAWQSGFQACLNGAAFYNPIQMSDVGAGSFSVDASFTAIDVSPVNNKPDNAGWWYDQWWRAARIIEAAVEAELGGAPIRMNILLTVGDYDTHSNEKARFEGTGSFANKGLAAELGKGMLHFRDAMVALGVWEECFASVLGDFGRNLWTNGGMGTDHAWGYALMVMGGRVRGAGRDGSNGLLGPFPDTISVDKTGSRDHQVGGILMPQTPLEEVFYQPLIESGLTHADLQTLMPNLGNFDHTSFVDVLAPPAPDYLFDGLTTPHEAWSLSHRLNPAYTGDLFVARRTSDNVELPIPQSGNLLDYTALATHLGASDGAVKRIYGQYGIADFNSATTTLHPYCKVTSNILVNGHLCAMPQTANNGLRSTAVLHPNGQQDFTLLMTIICPAGSGATRDWFRSSAVGPQVRSSQVTEKCSLDVAGVTVQGANNSNPLSSTIKVYIFRRIGSAVSIYINDGSTAYATGTDATAMGAVTDYTTMSGDLVKTYGLQAWWNVGLSNAEVLELMTRTKALYGI